MHRFYGGNDLHFLTFRCYSRRPLFTNEAYCDLTMSPHLGYFCPEVLNVPGRTEIRWHIGNHPKEVLGYCVVGTAVGTNEVENSRTAFEALMTKLEGQTMLAEYHVPFHLRPPRRRLKAHLK